MQITLPDFRVYLPVYIVEISRDNLTVSYQMNLEIPAVNTIWYCVGEMRAVNNGKVLNKRQKMWDEAYMLNFVARRASSEYLRRLGWKYIDDVTAWAPPADIAMEILKKDLGEIK